ncbi:MAG: GNAT family N-acetyltransferase, partial [Endozoicomonas sp.]
AEVIFVHARESLGNQAEAQLGCIHFLAPDVLVASAPVTDLLMVDEAAAIPAPLLEAMLKRHSRIVFATTVHGYEGTGRGFAVRFRKTLDAITPQWRELRMEEPIRWRSGDPVEAFVFQALLLNAAPCHGRELAGITPEQCHFRPLSRMELLSHEALLNELFGLLVLAHYQTRPFDLRHLLDGGNIEVYGLFFRSRLVGTVLAAREGDIDDGLREAILLGQRRVKGHLLPQTLSHHLGIRDSVALQGLRIIRIAVHPQSQGMGLGKKMMASIRDQCVSGGMDYLGTLFGATEELLAFWHQVGMVPVRIGVTREAASGAHSVLMLH